YLATGPLILHVLYISPLPGRLDAGLHLELSRSLSTDGLGRRSPWYTHICVRLTALHLESPAPNHSLTGTRSLARPNTPHHHDAPNAASHEAESSTPPAAGPRPRDGRRRRLLQLGHIHVHLHGRRHRHRLRLLLALIIRPGREQFDPCRGHHGYRPGQRDRTGGHYLACRHGTRGRRGGRQWGRWARGHLCWPGCCSAVVKGRGGEWAELSCALWEACWRSCTSTGDCVQRSMGHRS
ncbi:hypothetical protein GGR56DRAFT_74747, partial [Xylariaceae sp. FL0804]